MRLLKFIPDDTNIGFLKWRNVAIGISVALMVVSVVLVMVRGLNFGIDFVGGQSLQVEFAQKPDIDELRTRIGALGLGDATIQQYGGSNAVAIRTGLPDESVMSADTAGTRLIEGVKAAYPDATTGSVETVSGKVSGELLRTGLISLILAMIGISIYIWVRFEWQFGVGALFALAHDVTLTFGFFALTQLTFDLNIVAALLTIIGYSLNDTIVVFDRIRENLRKFRKMDMISLLDLSVNETLSRTIMTNVAVMGALLALLLLGPDVIFGFTAAMLLGMFIGTYSSIYMGAPWLVWLKATSDSFVPQAPAGGAERVAARDDGAVV